jgi:adenylosuccinate synthase
MAKIDIVVGLGFGDEGKGLVTSYLSSLAEKESYPLVIRFNGGHQAGHTVVKDGIRHVFSNFGSGSLHGVPTFISKFCTFDPLGVLNEHKILRGKGVTPMLFVDPFAMVTTPFDKIANEKLEAGKRHGSVGVGFGQTIKRNEDYYKLHFQDLFYPDIVKEKLKNISYYYGRLLDLSSADEYIKDFILDVQILLDQKIIEKNRHFNPWTFEHLIFEGAQGVMLDMDHGFFPNVTRSNTTSKNAIQILKDWNMEDIPSDVHYVSRVYHTRHGNGYLPGETKDLKLINNEKETNISHKFQGEFRKAPLNIDLLNFAINTDKLYSPNSYRKLYLTCRDQLGGFEVPVIIGGEEQIVQIGRIPALLEHKFKSVTYSGSDDGTEMLTCYINEKDEQ